MKSNDYTQSNNIFNKYKEEHAAKHDGHFGSCNWELKYNNFRLECWNVVGLNSAVIYQIWPDGNGFTIWQSSSMAQPISKEEDTVNKCKFCHEEINEDRPREEYKSMEGYCSWQCVEKAEHREMIEAGFKDEGYRTERLNWLGCDREKAFFDQWKKENIASPGINFGYGILQDLFMEASTHGLFSARARLTIEPRDRFVAATVIQWLGTNVGWGFLYEALRDCGYMIVERPGSKKADPQPTAELPKYSNITVLTDGDRYFLMGYNPNNNTHAERLKINEIYRKVGANFVPWPDEEED